MTGVFRVLRAAERFGMDPGIFDEMEPGRVALYLAYSDLRNAMESTK